MPTSPAFRKRLHERPPLDDAALERLAIGYAGRYATTRAKLATYLRRKLKERGYAGESEPPVASLVERFADLGYVDDRAVAEGKGRALARRGLGARRLGDTLRSLGIDEADSVEARSEAESGAWATALRFAERRRLGPYAREAPDEAGRRRAFAAMMRAGHSPDHTRLILASPIGIVPTRDE